MYETCGGVPRRIGAGQEEYNEQSEKTFNIITSFEQDVSEENIYRTLQALSECEEIAEQLDRHLHAFSEQMHEIGRMDAAMEETIDGTRQQLQEAATEYQAITHQMREIQAANTPR